MSNVYKTARGVSIDIEKLKLMNETTLAVGNAGVNARGDLIKNGKVIKTREQIAQETYNISGNNIVKKAKIKESEADIEPDFMEPLSTPSPYDQLTKQQKTVKTISPTPLDDAPRGGLADAVNKSKELAEKLAAQRKRL